MPNEQLVLIDGHALAYRMFYALPIDGFTTKEGEPTNATYGFTRMVLEMMQGKNPPKYLAVSFDVGKTFRDEMFEAYKGTREKMPDELRLQIKRIHDVLEALNVPILELDNYEADDVIGTIAHQMNAQGTPVNILTGDRDLLQLVTPLTTVELPARKRSEGSRIYTAEMVEEEYGITPSQVVDWKALEGDKSDNIPGVAGVGRKTAVKLLKKYGDLDTIYANLDEIENRWRTKLEADKDNAYLSQKLAQIVKDAPISVNIEECVLTEFEREPVLEMFRMLEFRSLGRLLGDAGEESSAPQADVKPTEWVTVRTEEQLSQLVKELEGAELIAFDVETTGLDKVSAELVGICLSVAPPVGYYIPVGHLDSPGQAEEGQMDLFATPAQPAEGQLNLQHVLDAIRPAMTDNAIPKVAHNAKFDYIILHRYGLTVSPVKYDTMLMEWLTDPASKFLGLKDLSRHRLGVEQQPITDLIGKGKTEKSFAEVPIEDAAPYGAADADVTHRLVPAILPELEEKAMTNLLDLEMGLLPVLSDMELAGIAIDSDFFAGFSTELDVNLGKLETEIHEIAGRSFNINSTQQLSDILFHELNLPHEKLKKTKSGHYSTASSVLHDLKPLDEDGIITKILDFREARKLKSTYVDALPTMVNPKTGRIHTSFNQTGAITGRIASNTPNLQNIPIRTETGRKVRRGFVAPDGWQFIAADYSQVELRILAHVSQDETLMQAFHEGQDVHSTTASAVFGIPLEEVGFDQRRFAKAVNFGLMYGMGPFRLARETDLTLQEAKEFVQTYFERFPGVKEYLDGTKQLAREQGYVETLFGRRQYFPVLQAKFISNQQLIARAERVAINHPIQGTAADIIKVAMIDLHNKLAEGGYQARMLLQVHDELILEAPDTEVETIRQLVVDTMSAAFKLDVPLKVESDIGTNWYDLKG